ncbi:TetR/AcrR family transcriptional regulator, partial [archaeon]|nr:TetR/AcrR family transcriptional regulator [archaeon]
ELEKVKDRILKEALSIITDGGFNALTMRNLASRVHMTAPNLYNYFSNKDEIYLTLVITGFEKLRDALTEAYRSSDDFMQRSQALMEAYVHFGIDNSAYYDIMFTRPTPKYNDYVGTPHEKLSRIEYTISMEIAALAEKAVREVTGDVDGEGGHGHIKDVIRIWCMLHGMVSLHNSNIIGYVAKDSRAIYDGIIQELIGSFVG